MIIRRGVLHDVLKVSRLWLRMVEETAPHLTPDVSMWRKHAEGFLTNGAYSIWVAEEGGRLVGFIDSFLFPEPSTGKLHWVGQHFYVLPEFRKGPVPGLIWRSALSLSKRNGAKVWEFCCFEGMRPFWEKRGFKQTRCFMRR